MIFLFLNASVCIVPRGFTGKPRVGSRVNLAALKDNSRLLFSRSLSLRSSHLLAFDLRVFNFFGYFFIFSINPGADNNDWLHIGNK